MSETRGEDQWNHAWGGLLTLWRSPWCSIRPTEVDENMVAEFWTPKEPWDWTAWPPRSFPILNSYEFMILYLSSLICNKKRMLCQVLKTKVTVGYFGSCCLGPADLHLTQDPPPLANVPSTVSVPLQLAFPCQSTLCLRADIDLRAELTLRCCLPYHPS